MDKIKFVKTRFEVGRGFQLNDGRIIAITDVVNGETTLALRFDTPFNLETGEIDNTFYPPKEYKGKDGLPDYAPEGFTTLNNLKAQKLGHDVFCYEEYCVNLGEHPRLIGDNDIKPIIAEFEEAGFKVTKDAILHNYYAWAASLKSGYRDEKNGYHLFTPCGGNPFTLSATTLHELCSDWQTTYEW